MVLLFVGMVLVPLSSRRVEVVNSVINSVNAFALEAVLALGVTVTTALIALLVSGLVRAEEVVEVLAMLTRSSVPVNSCTVARLADGPLDGRAVLLANDTAWETVDADVEVVLVLLVEEKGIDAVELEGEEETDEVYEPIGSVVLDTPEEVYVVGVINVTLEVDVKEGVGGERLPGSGEALDIGIIGSGRVLDAEDLCISFLPERGCAPGKTSSTNIEHSTVLHFLHIELG
ncbi:hypothetical protein F5879DRAFT_940959 [Lentinula edodes]|nr:hypothetical protein F5879DRAFT_940959 [Lentinula edodes]